MLFVDGENFTIRAEAFAKEHGLELKAGRLYEPSVFVWLPSVDPLRFFYTPGGVPVQPYAVRAAYYTALTGTPDKVEDVRARLWHLGFHPEVFKKESGKSKGVDISLAKDVLGHALRDHFDIAILVAGDGDYAPLVEDVKRAGKVVYVVFFIGEGLGLSPRLHLAADTFFPIDALFMMQWLQFAQAEASGVVPGSTLSRRCSAGTCPKILEGADTRELMAQAVDHLKKDHR